MGRKLGNIDLTVSQRKEIAALLKRYLPDTEVWAYGSRVKFTAEPHSDLDMAAFASKEQSLAVANLKESFEESALPFRVDLFVWDEVPEQFHQNIEAEHVVLQVAKADSSLAEGWAERTLGEVSTTNDATYSKKDKWKFIHYLDTGNLTENQISDVQHLVVGKDNIPSRAKRKVQPGDIVYSTVRPNQKHYGILKNPLENLLVSTGFVTIRGKKEEADTSFIYWFLVQSEIIEKLQTLGEHSTSAYPSIKPSDIESLKLKLPPLPEQKAIAHILGSLEDKIELNRRMNETLEAMAQALFKSWFVDFDPVIDNALAAGNEIPEELTAKSEARREKLEEQYGSLEAAANSSHFKLHHSNFPSEFIQTEEMGWIPKGWEVSTVGEEVEIVGGGTPDTNDDSYWTLGIHAFCTPKDMSTLPTKVLLNTERLLTDKGIANVSSGQLPSGTVLMSSSAPIGYLAITDVPVTVNQGIIAMVKQERFSELFLLCWASCNIDKIIARANGSTFLEISKKNYRPIPFLFPEDNLREAFNRQTGAITKRLISCTRNMKELSLLRDTILPQLLSGELRLPAVSIAKLAVRAGKLVKRCV